MSVLVHRTRGDRYRVVEGELQRYEPDGGRWTRSAFQDGQARAALFAKPEDWLVEQAEPVAPSSP